MPELAHLQELPEATRRDARVGDDPFLLETDVDHVRRHRRRRRANSAGGRAGGGRDVRRDEIDGLDAARDGRFGVEPREERAGVDLVRRARPRFVGRGARGGCVRKRGHRERDRGVSRPERRRSGRRKGR